MPVRAGPWSDGDGRVGLVPLIADLRNRTLDPRASAATHLDLAFGNRPIRNEPTHVGDLRFYSKKEDEMEHRLGRLLALSILFAVVGLPDAFLSLTSVGGKAWAEAAAVSAKLAVGAVTADTVRKPRVASGGPSGCLDVNNCGHEPYCTDCYEETPDDCGGYPCGTPVPPDNHGDGNGGNGGNDNNPPPSDSGGSLACEVVDQRIAELNVALWGTGASSIITTAKGGLAAAALGATILVLQDQKRELGCP